MLYPIANALDIDKTCPKHCYKCNQRPSKAIKGDNILTNLSVE